MMVIMFIKLMSGCVNAEPIIIQSMDLNLEPLLPELIFS